MDNSQLVAIISRLDSMTKDSDITSRRFEKDGQQRCEVSYDAENQTFSMLETNTHQRFEFDNIDLAAMEIYDLLND